MNAARAQVQRPSALKVAGATLQRKCACEGSAHACEECGKKDVLRRKADGSGGPEVAPPIVHEVLRSPGEPLDTSTRAFMESRFGHDFRNVWVHSDSTAAESARSVEALAYTVGSQIVFAAGRYRPRTPAGRQLIAHELTHVVQQRSARSALAGGLVVSDCSGRAEREAEASSRNASAGATVGEVSGAPVEVTRQPATSASPSPPCPFPSDFANDHEAGLNMMCVTDTSRKMPPACVLTDAHMALLNAAKANAKDRVSKARRRLSWVGGPEFAQRVGARVFTDQPPSVQTVKDTLDRMDSILGGQALNFAGATCADPECESPGAHAAAYESGPGQPVTLCPRSFLPSYRHELPRTVIHEVVHLSGIDIDPNIKEAYCMTYRCDVPCQSTHFADAWALFIDCIGGPLAAASPPKQAPRPAALGS